MNVGAAFTKIAALIAASTVGNSSTGAPNGVVAPSAALSTGIATPSGLWSFQNGASIAGGIDYPTLWLLTQYTNTSLATDLSAFATAATGCVNWYSSIIQLSLCDAFTESAGAGSIPVRLGGQTGNASYGIAQNVCNKAVSSCSNVWYFLWKASWLAQAASYLAYYNGSTTAYTTGGAEFYTFPSSGPSGAIWPTAAQVNTSLSNCNGVAMTAITSSGTCSFQDADALCTAFINIVGGKQSAMAGITGVGASGTTYYSASALRRRLTSTADGSVYVDANGIDITTGTATSFVGGGGTAPATSVAYAISATGPSSYPILSTATWSTGYVAPSSNSTNTTTNNTTTSGSSAQVLLGSIISAFLALALLN